jgi:hypothetical protein
MTFASVCFWLLFALVAEAEVYQWTDDQGRVHFGDRAAAQAVDQPVLVEIAPVSTYTQVVPLSSPGTGLSAEDSRALRERRAKAVAREAKLKADRERRCAQYRARYDKASHALSSNMDKLKDRRDLLNRLRQDIDEWCDH